MCQINNRFYIGIGIVESICTVFWVICAFGLPNWVAALVTFLLNSLYFSLFFFGLKSINKEEKEIEEKNKQVGKENILHISLEQAKQFKKEGALEINGKKYINKDHKLWKLNNRRPQLET